FVEYAAHYIRTDGQLYTTDSHQYGTYVRGYHAELDQHLHATCPGSEMITELYVPPHRLMDFLRDAARQLSGHGSIAHAAQVIYGTIRLARPDTETFLPWAHPLLTDGSGPAPDRWACVIFNLHIDHIAEGLTRAAEHFRGLINLATARGGSYYLTYHRFATGAQLRTAHPRIDEFMAEKAHRDPHGVLTSDWYEHTREVLAGSSASAGRDGEH
ncbi:MAG: hypothetical protein MUE97_00415, partial [Phycisphaerales bacterium]|nr:hypothetical protein [Phycisphaerales bacterium]